MSREKTLVKNFAIFAIGNFGSKALSFALIPIYTWFLTKEEIGIFDLIMSAMGFLVPLISLQLSESLYRWLLDTGNDKIKSTIIISSVIKPLIYGFFLSLLPFLALAYFYELENGILIFVLMYSMIIFTLTQQVLRGLKFNKLFAFGGGLYSALLIITNIIFLIIYPLNVKGLIIAGIISNLVASIFLIYRKRLLDYIDLNKHSFEVFKGLIGYSLPLIPSAIGWWLTLVANRFLIINYLGTDDNGIYAVAARFPSILVMINSVFFMAWKDSSILAYTQVDKDEYYTKIFNKYMVFDLSLVLVLICSCKLLAGLILNPEFYESWKFMPILYITSAFAAFAAFFEINYLGAKKTLGAFISAICGGMVTMFLSYLLLEVNLNLYGIALSTMIGFIVIFVYRIINTRKYSKIDISYGRLFGLLIACSISYLILFTENVFLESLTIASSLFLFLYLNSDLLLFGFKKFCDRISQFGLLRKSHSEL